MKLSTYPLNSRSFLHCVMARLSIPLLLQVDHWLEFASLLVNGVGLAAVCQKVNEYLSLRAYLAGHQPTAADVVCWAQICRAELVEGVECCAVKSPMSEHSASVNFEGCWLPWNVGEGMLVWHRFENLGCKFWWQLAGMASRMYEILHRQAFLHVDNIGKQGIKSYIELLINLITTNRRDS